MAEKASSRPVRKPKKPVVQEDVRFRELAETTTSAIFIFQGTRLKYVNPATEKLTGYSRQELLEMNLYDIFPGGKKKYLRTQNMRIQRGEGVQPLHGEATIIMKGGEERWIDLTATTIEYDGKPAGLGTAHDVTERKRAEQLQDAVYRIAQAADRSESLEELFPALHAIVAEVMRAENFYIALIDAGSGLISFPYYVDIYDAPFEPTKPGKGLTEYIFSTGRSLLCDEAKLKELEATGEVELIGTNSPIWLGVPLSVDNNVIGVMVVQDYHNPRAYGEREQRVLEFVSSQVAMVIHRKRSEEALRKSEELYRRRAAELTAMYETSRDLGTQRDLDTLLNLIADRVIALFGSPGCSIYLYNEDRGDIEVFISRGWPEVIGKHLQLGEGLAGRVAQSLQPMVVEDHRTWELRSPTFAAMPTTAVAGVPMLYGGELVGVLTIYELEKEDGSIRKYSQADVDLLGIFAGNAASAVHNARLFDETRQRLVELELLYQASLSASQIHSVHAVAQRIVETIEHLLNWKGSIWLVEDQRLVLLAYSTLGLTPEKAKEDVDWLHANLTSFDDGIVGWVCKNGRTVCTGDVGRNPHYLVADGKTRSELCVPLKVGGKVVGCVNVESPEPNAFSEHDERLLNTLANQAAVAIENARLFEETRRRAVRQAALNTIITASARAGTTLNEILNIALDQTLKALGLDMGALWLSWSPRGVQRIASRNIPASINLMMENVSLAGGPGLSRTVAVDDWKSANHAFAERFLSVGIQSTIVVPLLSKEKNIGGMAITSVDPRHWSTEEVALVEAVGREIGSAAESARLFEETSARLNELEVVNKVSTSLRLAQSIKEILPKFFDETINVLDVEAGAIWFYDNESGKLHQEIGRGWCLQLAHLEVVRGEGVVGAVFSTGDIYYSSDIAADPKSDPATKALMPPLWSAICLPILSEQESLGVLLVSTPRPREFTSENARLLVTLTEMAGSAIRRMRLTEQTMRHAVELEERVAERTAALQTALQKAQAADRLKSEFIANVNHELRTPLTNLVLYYQMLRSQPNIKTEERLDVIGRELQRLRSLIEELLNLSRLDLGQVVFRLTPYNLNALIKTLVNDRQSMAEGRGLVLTTELPPDLDSVWLDEQTMVQAISNLLTNAMNYTPRGGMVKIRTMKESRNGEDWVGFSVEDTGPGIVPEDIPHLFERFYRGKAGRESGAPGTGLGLPIVKQIVEHHFGVIEVHNGVNGRGAVFTVWLPVKKPKDSM